VQASGVPCSCVWGMARAVRRQGALPLVIRLCMGEWAGGNGQVKVPGPAGGIEADSGSGVTRGFRWGRNQGRVCNCMSRL